MSGTTSLKQAQEDREIERILNMTREEAIAECGSLEAYERKVAEATGMFDRALAEAKRRLAERRKGKGA